MAVWQLDAASVVIGGLLGFIAAAVMITFAAGWIERLK